MQMGIAVAIVLLFSLGLIATPIVLSVLNHPIGVMSSGIMLGSGVVLVVACAAILTITKLYVKTRASEAFVRTGMGGLRVIRDGGSLVLPVIHQIVRVSLETIRLDVERIGADALITADKLRADIKAEFFVRVQPEDTAIQAAARSLGDKMTEDHRYQTQDGRTRSSVAMLIEDKLVSALRTAAARKTLEQLNSERDEFLKEVMTLVTADLEHNGFTLETVTISKLDQTDEQHLKGNNIFDAQGMRTIAEITQKNLTAKNEIVRTGEQARAAQDVETRKKVLELERAKAEAEAAQATQIAVVQAEQQRVAAEKKIEADRAVQIATVEQAKQVAVAQQAQAQATEIAEKDKLRAVTEADQKVEVARRAQLKAVAEADALKAAAEAKLAEAEAARQKARQEVITVEEIAKADREKQKGVIAAQGEADKAYVTAQKAADANAYKVKAEADARKASADADAEAMRKKADAEAIAATKKAEGERAAAIAKAEGEKARLVAEAEGTRAKLLADAEGQKAVAMVPVEVKAREVAIEKQRVEEVLKPELEAREQSGKVAQDFELARIKIEKEAEVRIEMARATATIYGKIQANVYGTPEDVARMGNAFMSGMGVAGAIGGFTAGANQETKDTIKAALDTAGSLVTAIGDKLASKDGEAPKPAIPPAS